MAKPIYRDFKPGDVKYSLADICKAENILGYKPLFEIRSGLDKASKLYRKYL